jgi:uncharacterized protein (DUF362 family)
VLAFRLEVRVDRRSFIKAVAMAAAAPAALRSAAPAAGEPGKRTAIYVVHGEDPAAMLAAGMARLGGFAAFVKKGGKVTIKANAAWTSRPDQGGNTSPELVSACVAACRAAGASEVVVPENPCDDAARAFKISGIAAAVEKAGGRMYAAEGDGHFREVSLPMGRALKTARVAIDVLDTGCLVDVPVVKSHGGARITCAMKNWMGSVADRSAWHRKGLDQCIADLSTLIKPALVIADATRVMTTEGPRGPGVVAHPGQIVLGRDPVAIDAYAATLLGFEPFDVPHVRIAHEMGIGCGDLGGVDVVHLDA